VPACETPGLVEWLNTTGNGAAGSISYKLQFTNLSGHRCTLNGFPFVLGVGLGATSSAAGPLSIAPTPH